MNPGTHRERAEQIVAHMALHGWRTVYGAFGKVGFYDDVEQYGVGVFWRDTVKDPDGELVGTLSVIQPSEVMRAPVELLDIPLDILQKTAKYTKAPTI